MMVLYKHGIGHAKLIQLIHQFLYTTTISHCEDSLLKLMLHLHYSGQTSDAMIWFL